MIGLDTNVLLRYFVQDNPVQSQAANELLDNLSSSDPGWISIVVLAELVWSLRKTYKYTKDEIVRILETLLSSKDIVLQDSEIVQRALLLHRNGTTGFADCLIYTCAQVAGCRKVVTFDQTASPDLGMELVT